MPTKRILFTGLAALVLVASVAAQFTSPAPLAWRWFQPTSVPPSSQPVVQGDNIYFAVGSRVFGIDLPTGNIRWRFPAGGIAGAFRATPVLVNGVLVAVADTGTVYGIDPTNGVSKWSFDLPGRAIGSPVIAGQYVVVAQADNKLVAINPATGQAGWTNPIQIYDGIQGQIGTNGDDVLVFDQNRWLYSISSITQKSTWKVQLVQLAVNASPVTVGSTIYLNSGSDLIAINAGTGRARWDTDTHVGQLAFAPAVSATNILVVSTDGQALAYDLNGKPANVSKKPINLGSFPVVAPTAVGDHSFIVPTSNGAINLVDPTYQAPDETPADQKKKNAEDDDLVIRLGKVDAPSKDLLWSFLVVPATETATNTTSTPGGFPGGKGPGGGAPGGLPGGGAPGFGRGGQQNNENDQPIAIQAASPAVLVGQTLLVAAKDGSLLAFDKNLGVDLTAPGVKMLWPNPGEQVSGKPPLQLFFKITDDATGVDVRSLSITIGGEPYDFSYSRDGFATVSFSPTGKNHYLSDGRKDIVVTSADWMGNKITKTFALFVDNSLPPIAPPGSQQNPSRPGFPGGPGGPGGPGRGGVGGGAGLGD